MLVVYDGVGLAHMGHLFAPYLSIDVRLSHPIESGSPLVSPGGDPIVWAFPSPAWEGGGPPTCSGALFLAPDVR